MPNLIHFEFPPPRSWEQFEEMCADLFEVMWSDPCLIRHGRAGQAQYGVDIVGTRGSISPIGLQCKKKSRWPVKKLTFAEVEAETEEAEKFTPKLVEFYILTTAPADERLERQVREFNEQRKKQNKFVVSVLAWPEITRRIALHDRVARKHFPMGGIGDAFTPLLATWYTRGGRLELTNEEWSLAVKELGEDYHDWPTGHVVIRQRETDDLLRKVRSLEARSIAKRKQKLELRRNLRYARERERGIEQMVQRLYTNPRLRFYLVELYIKGAARILRAIIEFNLRDDFIGPTDQKIRVSPPSPERLSGPFSRHSIAHDDVAVYISSADYLSIFQKEQDFPNAHYGNRMVRVVSELPEEVRSHRAIPAIIWRIDRIMREDRKTLEDLDFAGYLELSAWKYTLS